MRRGYGGTDRNVDHEEQAEAGSGSCSWGCVVAQDRHLLPSFRGYPNCEFENRCFHSGNAGRPGSAGASEDRDTRRPRMAEQTKELKEKAQEVSGQDGKSGGPGLTKVLLPAAATAAAAAAAGLAAKKGPDLMRKLSGEANDEAEKLGRKGVQGAKSQLASGGGIAGKAASKLLGGGGGGGQRGGKTRRLPIQRWTDVAVPVEKAFRAWTQFEEFPKFMHRVLDVKHEDRDKVHFTEKIWFSTREWDG